MSAELLEDDHLIGIAAGQAVDRQAGHSFHSPRLRRIAQGVQSRSIEPSSRVAVIHELADHLMSLGDRPGA
jgi:hypothetical protein